MRFIFHREASLVPEGIKIEPIVRSETRVVLQAANIPLRPLLDFRSSSFAIQRDLVRKMLEVDLIAITTAIKPKEKDDRAVHESSNDNRPNRKGRGRIEELALNCLAVARHPVTKGTDQKTGVQAFLHAK